MLYLHIASHVFLLLAVLWLMCVATWTENQIPSYILMFLYFGMFLILMFLYADEHFRWGIVFSFPTILFLHYLIDLMFLAFSLFVFWYFAVYENKRYTSMATFTTFKLRKNLSDIRISFWRFFGLVCLASLTIIGASFIPFTETSDEKIQKWCLDHVSDESIKEDVCEGVREIFSSGSKQKHIWQTFSEHDNSSDALDSVVREQCFNNTSEDKHSDVIEDLYDSNGEEYVDYRFDSILRDVSEICNNKDSSEKESFTEIFADKRDRLSFL